MLSDRRHLRSLCTSVNGESWSRNAILLNHTTTLRYFYIIIIIPLLRYMAKHLFCYMYRVQVSG